MDRGITKRQLPRLETAEILLQFAVVTNCETGKAEYPVIEDITDVTGLSAEEIENPLRINS